MTVADVDDAGAVSARRDAGRGSDGQDGLLLGGDAEGVVCLALRGDIDLDTADGLRSAVLRALQGGDTAGEPPVALVLDLSGVAYLDSAGFGVLVDSHRAATQAGCRLVLCRLQAQVARAMRITNLDRYLYTAPSIAEARAVALGGVGSSVGSPVGGAA